VKAFTRAGRPNSCALVRHVLDAYPHLASLAPAHLFADGGEPELDERARSRTSVPPPP
jgi:hypothetical protein